MIAPVEAEPADVVLDGSDELVLLPGRVGVIEAQVAAPAELSRDAEIQADRLGVADMEIAVGLGREAGDDGTGAPGIEIGADDVADEIPASFLGLGPGHPILALVAFRSRRGARPIGAAAGNPMPQLAPLSQRDGHRPRPAMGASRGRRPVARRPVGLPRPRPAGK